MGRHKNPQYNRKRLVVAGVAAVTTLGVAVGIGIYGSAFADQPTPAASQECLPAPPPASSEVAPTETTTEPPASETAPPETAPTDTATDTNTETATDTETATEEPTETDQPTDEPTDTGTSLPDETATEEEQPQGYAGDQVVALNGERPRGSQPSSSQPAGTETNQPTETSAPGDEGGPIPSEQPPTVPPSDAEPTFPGGEECQDEFGPFPEDFVDIRKVPRSEVGQGSQGQRGSRVGVFRVNCGVNDHINSANVIAAPGNENGAQHSHNYVGNKTTDGFSTDESLAAGDTTCTNGDRSAYFWPLIRIRNEGSEAVDPLNAHNFGDPIEPASATIEFRGNPRGPVVAAPQFLRILTGNAKSKTQNGANQNAKWTCTGFENRVTDKYPLCPRGSQTVRIADFPGCNDGNTDSANHRTHLAFADNSGNCPEGFQAIPQLRITLKYNLPRGKLFALDAFPDEKHSPVTDHNDFINVMGEDLMNQVVQCVNSGRRC